MTVPVTLEGLPGWPKIAQIREAGGSESPTTVELAQQTEPVVLRGVASGWEITAAAGRSTTEVLQLLRTHASEAPARAFSARVETGGRYCYNIAMDGFNFQPQTSLIGSLLDDLANEPSETLLYAGSLPPEHVRSGTRHTHALSPPVSHNVRGEPGWGRYVSQTPPQPAPRNAPQSWMEAPG